MLDEDPEVILRRLFIDEWNAANVTAAEFDPTDQDGGINTGQDREIRTEPQITIIHVSDTTTGNTGYNAISGDGPVTTWGVMMQVDVWVPRHESFSTAAQAKRLRWQLQEEVKRIIHANAQGTTTRVEAGSGEQPAQQLFPLGLVAVRRSLDRDPSPPIYRSSMDMRTGYRQRPPSEA